MQNICKKKNKEKVSKKNNEKVAHLVFVTHMLGRRTGGPPHPRYLISGHLI